MPPKQPKTSTGGLGLLGPSEHGYVAVTIGDDEPPTTATVDAQQGPRPPRAAHPDQISGLVSVASLRDDLRDNRTVDGRTLGDNSEPLPGAVRPISARRTRLTRKRSLVQIQSRVLSDAPCSALLMGGEDTERHTLTEYQEATWKAGN